MVGKSIPIRQSLTIQDRTSQPTVFVLHNCRQEASKRFLSIYNPQRQDLHRLHESLEKQPRLLICKRTSNTPFLKFINLSWFPLLISGPLRSCSFSDHHKIEDPPKPGLIPQKITSSSCLLDCLLFSRRTK